MLSGCITADQKHTITVTSPCKRVRRPHGSASSATPERDWTLLPDDVLVLIGDCLLADNDLDYYMNFRAVCKTWRRGTDDPMEHAIDPRFQSKVWAVLKDYGSPRRNCLVSMVNLKTCRVVCKKIPILRNYHYINATDGGLLVLWDGGMPPWQPCRALVLNPFTASMVFFEVPIFAEGIRAVAVHASPLMVMLFASNLFNFVGWADNLSSHGFEEHRVQYPDLVADMRLFAGDIYVVSRQGSIFSTADAAIADEGTTQRPRSARMITMKPTIIHAADSLVEEEDHPYYHLVESAGELLLVTRPTTAGEDVLVHKVDTVNKVLEPVMSIGSRAIFISEVRSFSIDTNMFPTVEGGCIYFVDTLASLNQNGIVASSLRLVDQRQEDIMQFGIQGLHFGPPTLVEVLADHCRYTPEHELEVYYGWDWDDDDSI